MDCKKVVKSYEQGFPVFLYEEPMKKALYDFKYKNQRAYASFFASATEARYGEQFRRLHLDGIIPVPVHPNKKRKRGYNQAELLAKQLGKRLDVPVYSRYLLREIDTNPQKELDDKSRMKNLKNAFKLGENTIKLKKVLLVDDIYTSGATIEACTQVLKRENVEHVYYTSVAIGKGYM
ncbi:MAG: ComF family protein [Eubacteriales bacterium]|nr:ComF family protein [Eubacteriales bacterium]